MRDEDPTLDTLSTLAKAAREVDPLNDPRWEALARGELSEAEQDALRSFGEEAGIPEAFEAFRPLDASGDEALVDDLLGQSLAPAAPLPLPLPLPTPRPANDPSPAKNSDNSGAKPENVVPWPRRLAGSWTAALAAAAVLFVVVRLVDPFGGTSVPEYSVTLSGGTATSRSADTSGELPKLLPSAQVELVLRPKTAAKGEVHAKAFLFVEGHAKPWSAPIERALGGSMRIAGRVDALFGTDTRGRVDVVLAVGAPDALSDDAALLRAVEGGAPPDDVLLLRQPLVLAEPPPDKP
jgi:hypothetical protein